MASRISAALLILWMAAAAACAPVPPEFPIPENVPVPDPAEVESVLFLVGDAGDARMEHSPILQRLRDDVEGWSERLEQDSTVVVLYLGDIVYPLGLHPPDAPEFPSDSAIVMDQVAVVAGPAAVSRSARAYFLAGNHDWGLEEEWAGFDRLTNLANFLAAANATRGANVAVAPDPGTGGPHVVDVGRHLRLLLLDTAWWILDGGQLGLDDRPEVLSRIREAMRQAGGREIMVAAHHPFRSAGPHGGEVSFWRTLGIRYLLTQSGAVLQDITSVPYRELEAGLRSIFASEGSPLAFVGGHEHSLQLFEALESTDPAYTLVSGSGSKLSSIAEQPGMLFGKSAPGYMRLIVEKDGGMTVFVEATGAEYLSCEGAAEGEAVCMEEGMAAVQTVHFESLR
ncbi:MAG: hypothetical protein WD737_00445 [Gemmatimonadota bacterium]